MSLLDDLKRIRELMKNPTFNAIAKKEGGKVISRVTGVKKETGGPVASTFKNVGNVLEKAGQYGGASKFETSLVADLPRSYGRTAERISSGQLNLKETPNPIKQPGKFLMSPQFEDAANLTDIVPGVGLLAGGLTDVTRFASKAEPVIKIASKLDDAIKSSKQIQKIEKTTKPFVTTFKDAFNIKVLERFDAVKELTKDLVKTGKISVKDDPYTLMSINQGVIGGKIESDYNNVLKPIIKNVGENVNEFKKLLVNKRILELGNRGIEKFPGGQTADDAAREIEQFYSSLGPEALGRVQQAEAQYQSYMKGLLKELNTAGLIDSKSYENILQRNEFYTPFEIVNKLLDEKDISKYAKNSFNVASQDLIKELKGSQGAILDPLEATMKYMSKARILIEKNKVAQSLAKLEKILPEEVIPLKSGMDAPKGFEKVSRFVDGVREDLAVEKDIADAFKGLTAPLMDDMTKAAGFFTSLFRAGTTTLNVSFLPRNVVRDVQTARLIAKHGLPIQNLAKGFLSVLRKDEVYDMWLRSGGKVTTSIGAIKDASTKIPTLNKPSVAGKALEIVTTPLRLIEKAGEVAESSTRVGVFGRALEKGEDITTSAMQARGSTVDFSKGGTLTKTLNLWIPYLNSRVQGTANTLSAFKNKPVQSSIRSFRDVVLPRMVTRAWNEQFKDYADVNERQDEDHFVIMLKDRTPEERENGDKLNAIRIPKSDSAKAITAVMDNLYDYIKENDPDSIKKIPLKLLDAVSPVGSTAGSLLSNIPPPLKAPLEVYTNKNFYFNSPIERPYQLGVSRDLIPEGERVGYNTTELAKRMGPVTGKVGISPADTEHLVQGFFGTAGMDAFRGLSALLTGKNEYGDVKKAPLISGIYGVSGNAQKSEQYDLAQKRAAESGGAKYDSRKKASEFVTALSDMSEPEKIKMIDAGLKNGELDEEGYKYATKLLKKEGRVEPLEVIASIGFDDDAKLMFIKNDMAPVPANRAEEYVNSALALEDLENNKVKGAFIAKAIEANPEVLSVLAEKETTEGLKNEILLNYYETMDDRKAVSRNVIDRVEELKSSTSGYSSASIKFLIDAHDRGAIDNTEFERVKKILADSGEASVTGMNLILGEDLLNTASERENPAGAIRMYVESYAKTSTGKIGTDAWEYMMKAMDRGLIDNNILVEILKKNGTTDAVDKRIEKLIQERSTGN